MSPLEMASGGAEMTEEGLTLALEMAEEGAASIDMGEVADDDGVDRG